MWSSCSNALLGIKGELLWLEQDFEKSNLNQYSPNYCTGENVVLLFATHAPGFDQKFKKNWANVFSNNYYAIVSNKKLLRTYCKQPSPSQFTQIIFTLVLKVHFVYKQRFYNQHCRKIPWQCPLNISGFLVGVGLEQNCALVDRYYHPK